MIRQQGYELEDWDIRWVLTVPAIWTAPAKQFMREAAQKVPFLIVQWYDLITDVFGQLQLQLRKLQA